MVVERELKSLRGEMSPALKNIVNLKGYVRAEGYPVYYFENKNGDSMGESQRYSQMIMFIHIMNNILREVK